MMSRRLLKRENQMRPVCRSSVTAFRLGSRSRIHDGVDGLLGIAGPAEGDNLDELLLGELASGLCQQAGAFNSVLSLLGEVGLTLTVGTVLGNLTETCHDLVVCSKRHTVGIDGALEDGKVVDLHTVAIQAARGYTSRSHGGYLRWYLPRTASGDQPCEGPCREYPESSCTLHERSTARSRDCTDCCF